MALDSDLVTRRGGVVAIVEDDPDQLSVLEIHLESAGLRTVGIHSGYDAVARLAELRPDIVLLDVDLPGVDGDTVCRTLKSMPALAATPIVFLTTKASINEKLSGLTLGADEYLCKPIDPRELLVRIRHLIARSPATTPEATRGALAFDAFSEIAADHFANDSAALALIRVPPTQRAVIVSMLIDESREEDVICRYDDGHLIWLLPGSSRMQALERARHAVERIRAAGHAGVTAGVSAGGTGTSTKDVVAEADEALAEARYLKAPAAVKADSVTAARVAVNHSVVLAVDDPDVMRAVDPHMKAAGFRTTITLDAATTLLAIRDQEPDVVVLDLMMPAMTGFEILAHLRDLLPRPRVIVLSARGREDDVSRAFQMGADDYIVKPFSPQELRARVLRLLR